jgi:hypothetical protein
MVIDFDLIPGTSDHQPDSEIAFRVPPMVS